MLMAHSFVVVNQKPWFEGAHMYFSFFLNLFIYFSS